MLSPEHLGMVYSYDFQFVSIPDMWLQTDVTIQEAFDVIKTGLLKNQPVSKIKMFAITESETSVAFVYDVVGAKQGNFPWSLLPS